MKSWTCIERCGACCKLDLNNRENIYEILSEKDIEIIKNMKCTIYSERPHFCMVNKFSKKFEEYFKTGDEFLIKCCKQHISEIYGKKSMQMNKFKNEIMK